jgi:hypothetical protein
MPISYCDFIVNKSSSLNYEYSHCYFVTYITTAGIVKSITVLKSLRIHDIEAKHMMHFY